MRQIDALREQMVLRLAPMQSLYFTSVRLGLLGRMWKKGVTVATQSALSGSLQRACLAAMMCLVGMDRVAKLIMDPLGG